jgi:hypothetical protein
MPTTSIDYFLWKAAKRVKQVTNSSHAIRTTRGTWARTNTEKAHMFADHRQAFYSLVPPTKRGRSPYYSTGNPLPTQTPCSASSIDQKFKPSSTTSNLNVLQATTSSRAISYRYYLPLASNISHRYSTLPYSQDTSLHNEK